jgi:hypothetical protein
MVVFGVVALLVGLLFTVMITHDLTVYGRLMARSRPVATPLAPLPAAILFFIAVWFIYTGWLGVSGGAASAFCSLQ